VQDAQLDAAARELVEHLQDRSIGGGPARRRACRPPPARRGAVILDHQLLQVGGRDPDAAARLHRGAHDAFVVTAPAHELERERSRRLREVHVYLS